MIKSLFTKVDFMFYTLILFFVTLWQKTRGLRSLFKFSQCRFYPSCSDYFLESIRVHGLVFGGWLSFKRFLKCNPLFEGGVDEICNGH